METSLRILSILILIIWYDCLYRLIKLNALPHAKKIIKKLWFRSSIAIYMSFSTTLVLMIWQSTKMIVVC